MKLKARGAIFDLDGTLLNTKWRFYKVFNETITKFGFNPISKGHFLSIFHSDKLNQFLFPDNEKWEEKRLEFWKAFLKAYQNATSEADHLILGVHDTLVKLSKQHVPIAVITGRVSPQNKIKQELDRFGIGKFFKVIVSKEEVLPKATKTRHLIDRDNELKKAAENLKIPIQECIFICDYVGDVRSGKAVGVKTVAVLSGASARPILEAAKPDLIINSVADLLDYVEFS